MKRFLWLCLLAIALARFVEVWLQYGSFSHREYGSLYFFKKNRFSPKFFFSSPIGESDTPLSSLPFYKQQNELDYIEFVGAFEVSGQKRWRIMN